MTSIRYVGPLAAVETHLGHLFTRHEPTEVDEALAESLTARDDFENCEPVEPRDNNNGETVVNE